MRKLHTTLFLHGGPGLHSAVEREWFSDTLPILWWDQPAVAGNPAPSGTLPDTYFAPHSAEARDRYFAMAGKTPPLDIASYFAVMQEFLHAPNSTQAAEYGGEVNILMGRDDPLLDLDEDKHKWLAVFPQAEFKLVEAGHFLHLELPPEIWFGAR